jgi:hypothetical protein
MPELVDLRKEVPGQEYQEVFLDGESGSGDKGCPNKK